MTIGCSTRGLPASAPGDLFRQLADAGFVAADISAEAGQLGDPATCDAARAREIRAAADAAGITIAAVSLPMHWVGSGALASDAVDRAAEAATVAANLGAPLLTTTTGPYPPQCDRFDAWDSMRGALLRATDQAESVGVAVGVTPHVGGICMTWESTVKLIREVGSRNLCIAFDAAQFLLLGLDFATALDRLAPRVAHVVLRDFALRRPPLGELREPRGNATPVAVGDGDLPLVEHLRHLKDVGYQGVVSVALPEDDPTEGLRRSATNLAGA